MLKEHPIIARLTIPLLIMLAIGFAAEPRRITVYAPQTNYQVDILVRDGTDYVGLTDLLEPLGHLETRAGDKKLTLIFNGAAADFQDGKRQYRTSANTKLELPSNFLLIDGRGYVPVAAIPLLLSRVANLPAEFHAVPRRLFVGSSQIHFTVELRHGPTRLVLSFPTPVNPGTQVERGRVHLLFRREPVVSSGADSVSYNDPFLASTGFAELPGGAEFVANVQQPATVNVSDGGHTITIQPAPQGAAQTSANPASAGNQQQHPAAPVQRARPFVILDAAHGGYETGALLSPTLQEKNVNLALARRLQRELDARGIPVVLTRVADNLLTWDQRAVSANTSHASLYIALHSSASGHGVRVYTSLLAAPQPGQSARSFLPWEMAQAPMLPQSTMAATALATECASDGLPASTSVAPVRPLNSVTIAAVAVEVAPMGSSADELGSAEYQQKIVTALANGIAALRAKLEAAQ